MKKILIYSILFLSHCAIAQNEAILFPNQQKVFWVGSAAVGNYAPEGTLTLNTGSIRYTDETIISLVMEVDMNSLEQENTQLRDHLKEADFFHVKKYPTATFELNKIGSIENGKVTLTGNMTIHGITQCENIEADVEFSKKVVSINFDHLMDRTRYGVNHNSPSLFKRLKENAISDNFILKGTLQFQNKENTN